MASKEANAKYNPRNNPRNNPKRVYAPDPITGKRVYVPVALRSLIQPVADVAPNVSRGAPPEFTREMPEGRTVDGYVGKETTDGVLYIYRELARVAFSKSGSTGNERRRYNQYAAAFALPETSLIFTPTYYFKNLDEANKFVLALLRRTYAPVGGTTDWFECSAVDVMIAHLKAAEKFGGVPV
jgi:hypothetical protein